MHCRLLITAEHATHFVPPRYRPLFAGHGDVLDSHRAYDPGTAALARRLAKHFEAPLVSGQVTRLLVELNRSLGHRRLFSEFAVGLDSAAKDELLIRYYHPYRNQVRSLVAEAIANKTPVLHVSVHSFTPALAGITRRADLGLLYDPARPWERAFCKAWRAQLNHSRPDLIVRRNYPYLGKSDGLTTALRREFGPRQYAGIELEVNQTWPLARKPHWPALQSALVASLDRLLEAQPLRRHS